MISITSVHASAATVRTHCSIPSKLFRPTGSCCMTPGVLPRCSSSSSRPQAVRVVRCASGGQGPSSSGSEMPLDISASGKASSNEGQMEGQRTVEEQQQSDTPVTPNPAAASMADKNIAPDSGSMAEQLMMNVQDRAPAIDIASEQSASMPVADKIAAGLKQVEKGGAGQQGGAEDNWAAQQAGMSPPPGDKTEGRTGTDSASELGKGRL